MDAEKRDVLLTDLCKILQDKQANAELSCDIRDLAALVDALQQVRPECVIHLAASVGEANIHNVYNVHSLDSNIINML
jgi:dTDP-4-dehydrorhamnose reductase